MKKIIYVLLGIVLLYLILAFIGPSKIDVTREISINRPASDIAPKMADLVFFNEKWNPWMDLDSSMKVSYKGEAGQVGHTNQWLGNKDVGEGIMEITAITPDSVTQKLTFGGHDGGYAYIITVPTGDSTTVRWQMKSDVAFFARPFMLFMGMEKAIGEMYDKGLPKLKKAIEELPKTSAYNVVEVKWEEKTYVGKRAMVSTENNAEKLSAFFMENYPKLFGELGKNKIEPIAPPSAIYFKWEEKQTDVAAVACVNKGTLVKGWENFTVPAGKALMVAYYGDDAGSMQAHNTIGDYLKKNNLNQTVVVEEYVTDRETEKDPAKWLTNIYYLLK
jgi:effector-binding domain-containing protein